MAEIFNPSKDTIQYVSTPTESAVVNISSNSGSTELTGMLVDSVSVNFQRSVNIKKFLSNSSALIIGKGSGTATLTGLFGSADQFAELLSDDWDSPCSIPRTITISAGVLKTCADDGSTTTSTNATLVLRDAVAAQVGVRSQMSDTGTLMEEATVAFVINGLSTQ